jgi:hypothetical protein
MLFGDLHQPCHALLGQLGALIVRLMVLCNCCRMPVAAGDVHQVVRSYLLYHGYGDTLTAFDAAAGAEGIAQPMR